ncbi:general transcription factor iih [Plasmopara halstedii]|uniref:General transcription factor iih n=1 Tax=Plasmopara halstedii TaxID=4781 RepID=A0A0P1AJA5_PLAHL|nr:general transcription factor iih [Plasmopara halstedii]CEG40953.1 general transcription factor iih [Plasmopara halstedii]|eukprot:XP_024577322.1 general transcription factor iih [Plasmopara halstedii]
MATSGRKHSGRSWRSANAYIQHARVSHANKSAILFPNLEQDDTTGSAEQAAEVNAGLLQRLQQLSDTPLDPAKPNQTAIAASLSRSLCFINRAINEEADLRPRILIVQKSSDVSEHYIAIMNGIFSAQKKNVAVDACILAAEHSSFMQQAAYLTGGIYYKPTDHSGMLQYLISIYLPDPYMRKLLRLPSQDSVDFRAMCFCHREVISTAHIQPKKNGLLKNIRRIDHQLQNDQTYDR